jgi:hypothetical protein
MPENEFEKQVKELMEQFHISPSAPVWEKIRKRITEKKRRIWPVFFLLASVVIVSGYFFYTDIKHSNQNLKTVQQSTNNSVSKQSANDSINKQENKNSDNQTTKTTVEQSNKKELSTAENLSSKNETVFTHKQSKNNLQHLNNKKISENSLSKKQTAEPNNNNPRNEIKAPSQRNAPGVTVNNTESNIQQTIDSAANKTSVVTAHPAQQNIVSSNIPPNNDSLQAVADNIIKVEADTTTINKEVAADNQTQNKKISPKKLKSSKWLFGVTGMYGTSNITDKLTNILTNADGEKSLSQGGSLNSPGAPLSNNSVVLKNPYNANNAYSFGVTVQRKIFKKSAINTGVNFVHLSSKNSTAISIDSVLIAVVANYYFGNSTGSNFYRAGTAKTYINHFNFIEIPVSFQSNIFSIKNFSLLYDAGFSVRHLLSSKSLIYNSKNNSFFYDDDLLRRTQFQINAGLNFQLHTKAGNFLVGPQLQYSLSPYLKTSDYDKLHFVNYGIRASWLLNKNSLLQ